MKEYLKTINWKLPAIILVLVSLASLASAQVFDTESTGNVGGINGGVGDIDVGNGPIPKPQVTPANPIALCDAKRVTFNISNPNTQLFSYKWYHAITRGTVTQFATGTTVTRYLDRSGKIMVEQISKVDGRKSERTEIAITLEDKTAPIVTGDSGCEGDELTLSVNDPSGVYKWYDGDAEVVLSSEIGILNNGATLKITGLTNSKSFKVRKEISPGCLSDEAVVTATIYPKPPKPTFVEGELITVTGSGAVTVTPTTTNTSIIVQEYRWYDVPNGGTVTSRVPSRNISLKAGESEVFYVSIYTTQGCEGSRRKVTIRADEIPPTPSATYTSADPCNIGPGLFQVTGKNCGDKESQTYGIEWFNSPEGGTPLETGYCYNVNINNTRTVYVGRYNKQTGVRSIRKLVEAEIPIRTAPSATGGSACQGGTITLKVNNPDPGSTYKWFDGDTELISIDNQVAILDGGATLELTDENQPSTKVYQVRRVLEGDCLSEAADATAIVNPKPPRPVLNTNEPNNTINGSGSITITASTSDPSIVDKYKWYRAGVSISNPGNSRAVSLTAGESVTYQVSILSKDGCEGLKQSIVVFSRPLPAPLVGEVDIPNECEPGRVTFKVAGVACDAVLPYQVEWYDSRSDQADAIFSESCFDIDISSDKTYFVRRVESESGLRSEPTEVKAFFRPLSPAPVVASESQCGPGNLVLSVQNPTGPYEWFTANGVKIEHETNVTHLSNNGASLELVEYDKNEQFIVKQAGSLQCESTETTVWARTYVIPTLSLDVAYNEAGSEATITASSENPTLVSHYNWYTSETGGTAIMGQSQTIDLPVGTSVSYWVSAASTQGCESSPRQLVTVVSRVKTLEILSPANQTNYCPGSKIALAWSGGEIGGIFEIALLKNGEVTEILGNTTQSGFNWSSGDLAEGSYVLRVTQGTQVASHAFKMLSSCRNFVKSYTARIPLQGSLSSDDHLEKGKVQLATQYIDGLGRPEQSVVRWGSPNGKDVVSPIIYDHLGRQTTQYLPYPDEANDPNGKFRENPLPSQNAFYDNHFGGFNGNFAKAKVKYEESPLNRVLEQGAVGAAWQLENGHTVKIGYALNTVADNVLHFEIDLSENQRIEAPTQYARGELRRGTTTDEDGNVMEQFSDKQGQVIAKLVDPTDINAITYYVYDVFHRLNFVIPPQAIKEMGTNYTLLNDEDFRSKWLFRYKYDGRSRMIEKQVPGGGLTRMIYDDLDRLILTQDANQRNRKSYDDLEEITGNVVKNQYENQSYVLAEGSSLRLADGFTFTATPSNSFFVKPQRTTEGGAVWSFTKYDHLNRPILTGEVSIAGEPIISGESFDTYDGSNQLLGYTNNSYPSVSLEDLYTVTYYDNYQFLTDQNWEETFKISESSHGSKGLATGGLTRVLGTETLLKSVSYYDEYFRVKTVVSDNHLGGEDQLTNTFYSDVSSLVSQTVSTHRNPQQADLVITEEFTYDHADRLLKVTHQINDEATLALITNEYNELGELKTKKLKDIQAVDYAYNMRGWLTKINGGVLVLEASEPIDIGIGGPGGGGIIPFGLPEEPELGIGSINTISSQFGGVGTAVVESSIDDHDEFFLELRYDKAGRYNGNIGEMRWKVPTGTGNSNSQVYKYTYDALNRLKTANYESPSVHGGFDVNGIDYDANGNIQSLTRKKNGANLDVLTYNYYGNQLTRVEDTGDEQGGFKDKNSTAGTIEYAYDGNGNMVSDANKGIGSISYNHLNLPEEVRFSADNWVKYTYDAAGIKLKKEFKAGAGASIETTDYVAGKHYKNGVLEFFQHGEGRVVKNGDEFNYEFHLTDHLGNVRVTLDESGNVVQRQGYYPFGGTFNSWTNTSPENNYQYNGKELQPETGWLDFGARMHDPWLGRWMTVDPLAELMRRESPYNYAFNNPVRFIDPDGMMGTDPNTQRSVTSTNDGRDIINETSTTTTSVTQVLQKGSDEYIAALGGSTINTTLGNGINGQVTLTETTTTTVSSTVEIEYDGAGNEVSRSESKTTTTQTDEQVKVYGENGRYSGGSTTSGKPSTTNDKFEASGGLSNLVNNAVGYRSANGNSITNRDDNLPVRERADQFLTNLGWYGSGVGLGTGVASQIGSKAAGPIGIGYTLLTGVVALSVQKGKEQAPNNSCNGCKKQYK